MSPGDAAYQKLLAELAALREKAARVCAEVRERWRNGAGSRFCCETSSRSWGSPDFDLGLTGFEPDQLETNLALGSASALDGLEASRDWTAQLAPPPCRPAVAEGLDVRFTGLQAMDNINCQFKARCLNSLATI
jgi:hypothetical protein